MSAPDDARKAALGPYTPPAETYVVRRDWCCHTPLNEPHVPGCDFEPREDNPIDYAEFFKPNPGALWLLPDFTWGTGGTATPEIPIPDELEALAKSWEDPADSGWTFFATVGPTIRAAWAAASAEIMAARRALIATTGADTELDYYGGSVEWT